MEIQTITTITTVTHAQEEKKSSEYAAEQSYRENEQEEETYNAWATFEWQQTACVYHFEGSITLANPSKLAGGALATGRRYGRLLNVINSDIILYFFSGYRLSPIGYTPRFKHYAANCWCTNKKGQSRGWSIVEHRLEVSNSVISNCRYFAFAKKITNITPHTPQNKQVLGFLMWTKSDKGRCFFQWIYSIVACTLLLIQFFIS